MSIVDEIREGKHDRELSDIYNAVNARLGWGQAGGFAKQAKEVMDKLVKERKSRKPNP